MMEGGRRDRSNSVSSNGGRRERSASVSSSGTGGGQSNRIGDGQYDTVGGFIEGLTELTTTYGEYRLGGTQANQKLARCTQILHLLAASLDRVSNTCTTPMFMMIDR